jgi:hypothetical protein
MAVLTLGNPAPASTLLPGSPMMGQLGQSNPWRCDTEDPGDALGRVGTLRPSSCVPACTVRLIRLVDAVELGKSISIATVERSKQGRKCTPYRSVRQGGSGACNQAAIRPDDLEADDLAKACHAVGTKPAQLDSSRIAREGPLTWASRA